MSHLSSAKREVDTNFGLSQRCASDFCNFMEAALNCIGFKTSVSKPFKLIGGFASRKMTAEQTGTKGLSAK